jgi:RimJ/RimL family protein N-acetyltransferase
LFAITQAEADEPIGLIEYRLDGDWLTVAFIALAKAYRGWGYGSEAVRLVEEWAAREGLAERFRAEVDVRNGLGLYFWLRLGYRPLAAAKEGRAVLAMVRDAA